jgi:hypothetical protein
MNIAGLGQVKPYLELFFAFPLLPSIMHFPITLVISLLAITPAFSVPTPDTDSTAFAARDVGEQTLQRRGSVNVSITLLKARERWNIF